MQFKQKAVKINWTSYMKITKKELLKDNNFKSQISNTKNTKQVTSTFKIGYNKEKAQVLTSLSDPPKNNF